MSMVQPGQLRVRPTIGFGMALLMISVVGDPFVSAAELPVAQPGKPPGGDQRAPVVSVQFPIGGGALDVTVKLVPAVHTAHKVVEIPTAASSSNVITNTTNPRRRTIVFGMW